MRSCVVCGSSEAIPWTFMHKSETSVVVLCEEHSAPIVELERLSLSKQPKESLPRVIRKNRKKLTPLDWTPPNQSSK